MPFQRPHGKAEQLRRGLLVEKLKLVHLRPSQHNSNAMPFIETSREIQSDKIREISFRMLKVLIFAALCHEPDSIRSPSTNH